MHAYWEFPCGLLELQSDYIKIISHTFFKGSRGCGRDWIKRLRER
jgi:hypothetical protein